jgi:predicted short-subunit dehydrogenase-like oxidoreductase (DUF2520 family)
MDIILIGSGNVATAIGLKSLVSGHRIIQVYSRKETHSRELARRLRADSTTSLDSIFRKADISIIALRDDALNSFIQAFGQTKSIVVHTAGAIPMSAVRELSESYGVLYPLQSLRKEIETIPRFTMLVDGNNTDTKRMLKEFTKTIGENSLEADDDTRLKYHLAATLVNNFTNHLFSLAEIFCKKENISFSMLQPLMEETVMRLRSVSPLDAQTGPAARNDQLTLQKHMGILKRYPDILSFYEKFSAEIQRFDSGVRL